MSGEGKVMRAVTSVTAVMLVSKLLALARNMFQAHVFGVGPDMDMFTLANSYTISLFTTVAYAMCVAAIPIFSRRLLKGKKEAYDAANRLISLMIVCSLAITALFLILNATGIAPRLAGAGDGDARLFQQCFALCSLALPVIITTYLLVSLFQSMEYFSLQGSLSLLYNVVLCTVLFVAGTQLSLQVFALVVAVGWVFQLAVVVPVARKEEYRFRFTFKFAIPGLSSFFKTCGVTILTTAVFLLCYLINTRFAAGMAEGTVSAYYYADKIFEPATTTLIYGIGIVMFPKFNQNYESMEPRAYCAYVSEVLKNGLILILPLSSMLCVFASPVIKVLFQTGSFDMGATTLTGDVFSAYALGMAGFFVLDLLSKAYFAMEKTRVPLITTIAVLVICVAANGLGVVFLPDYAEVLAYGTSAALLLGGGVMYVYFCRSQQVKLPWKALVRSVVLSLFIGICMYTVYINFISMETRKLILVPQCIMLGVVSMIVYLILMGRELPTGDVIRKWFRGDKK